MRHLSWRTGRTLWTFLVVAVLAMMVASLASAVVASTPAIAIQHGATYAYGTVVYNYDAPAPLSSQSSRTTYVPGSPSGPEAASWVSPASVGGDGVAANTARAADAVLYSPQVASRNLLGQLGEGYATTPGGRTVSAHAADRIVNGAPGRAPTTLSRVDGNLDNPTGLRYDPVADAVRVSQGKDFVVVSGTGPGQQIVTVMVR
ncbi:hypothetical protein [Cellulomonas bogoriensis]|uniref:Uncharacterized protein n=1 Tax=Cellulomonas bogoriensis 69B4 = DSM 16987 TaxID=1386082 RepID=A0A0A0C0S8_9CELL|nr:hypothetical protein [Cellulomonas bogoriensis]KGM13801.1 hypothetical protein N869_09565 [Cellulomonas bogoriensis 69B4 = DSM 16987]